MSKSEFDVILSTFNNNFSIKNDENSSCSEVCQYIRWLYRFRYFDKIFAIDPEKEENLECLNKVDKLVKDSQRDLERIKEKMNELVEKCRNSISEFAISESLSNLLKDSSLLEYPFFKAY